MKYLLFLPVLGFGIFSGAQTAGADTNAFAPIAEVSNSISNRGPANAEEENLDPNRNLDLHGPSGFDVSVHPILRNKNGGGMWQKDTAYFPPKVSAPKAKPSAESATEGQE